jgi:hypothetical protein
MLSKPFHLRGCSEVQPLRLVLPLNNDSCWCQVHVAE